jgi:hypothetical protein
VANVVGGVHAGEAKTPKEEKLDELAEEISLRNEQGAVARNFRRLPSLIFSKDRHGSRRLRFGIHQAHASLAIEP